MASNFEEKEKYHNKHVKSRRPRTKNMDRDEYENSPLRNELEGMSKDQLVKAVTEIGKNDLRHSNFNIAMLNERMTHFDKAIKELVESIEIKVNKARKYRNIGDDPERAIKAIERIIDNDKKKIQDFQVEVDKFEKKKQHKAIEQQDARKEIDKKLVKRAFTFLEKNNDPVIVELLEAFVALLRNQPTSNREDVELYLQNYNGLLTALSKVDERLISGANARNYSETIDRIRHEFHADTPYAKFIPFLVYLNQTCSIISLTCQEREYESQISNLEEGIGAREREIDEIQTYAENVFEVIDYDAQVEEERKALQFMAEHYLLLQMRMYKIQKYSRLFKHYYFRDVKDKTRLNERKWEKIDCMDDLDNLDDIEDQLDEVNLVQSVTRILKIDKNDNPLGDNTKVRELEKEVSYVEEEKPDAEGVESSEPSGSSGPSGSSESQDEADNASESQTPQDSGTIEYTGESYSKSATLDEEDSESYDISNRS
jgi:hypothetical protein